MCIVVYKIRITTGVYVMELYGRTDRRDWCDGIVCSAMAANTEANGLIIGVYVQRHEFDICNAIGLYPFG